MTRTDARILMMQCVFQMEAQRDFDINKEERYFSKKNLQKQEEYCKEMFSILINKKEEIDSYIEKASKSWTIRRMSKIDLAILRVATAEIKFMDMIDSKVSINEAVKLADKFGTEKSGSFVNGVLSGLL